ncbi:hypothetical protein [uncultured Pseudokineococcus sp.]|uniref:hypothetical protein n=1 Tax=uncultured Pseudokineococcus sp. TaxID=1642928 RepID=UPI00263490E1|nr:hypothetical protein [uncultured Pseudokineococcus sp.]
MSGRPEDAAGGRGEDPVDVDAAWADIVARWGEPAAEPGHPRGGPRPDQPRTDRPGTDQPRTERPGTDRPGTDGPGPAEPRPDVGDAADARPDPDPGPTTPQASGGPVARGWDDVPLRAPGEDDPWRSAPVGSGDGQGRGAPDRDGEEHYTPPEPVPGPPTPLVTRLAWAGAVAGPAVLLLCALVWRDAPALVVAAAVVAFVGGFGVLVARLPRSHDDDDGAVV